MQNNFNLLYKLILFFVVAVTQTSNGQSLKFDHYNDNDGLSHNSIRHIVQDKHGFLWIGTFSGLNRFDGYEVKQYLSNSEGDNKINNDDITALEFDEESNNLWIGTREGLTLLNLNNQQFTTFLNDDGNPKSLPENEIRSVFVDSHKHVWVGTREQGLYRFYLDKKEFVKVDLPDFDYIKEIFEDSAGNIWIGSYNAASVAKIYLDEGGEIQKTTTFEISDPENIEKSPYLHFIFEDSKKDIFAGTRKGLYKLNKKKQIFEDVYINNSETRAALGPYFVSIAQAPDGKYWVGTLGGILVCDALEDIALGDFEWHYSILTDQTSLVDNLVTALYFDPSGILWIGTEDGLDKYDPNRNHFKFNKDISKFIGGQAPRIRGFAKTYNNKIVVATRHNGLFIKKNEQFVPLFNNQKDITSIYTRDGKLFYCGLWNGKVLIYNYLNNQSVVVDVGLGQVPISVMKIINENDIIVGTFGKGARILEVKGSTILANIRDLLEDGDINEILTDNLSSLWFATETGIVKYDAVTKEKTTYTTNEGLPHINVSDIIFDKAGKLWAATRSGLCYLDTDKNTFIPTTDFGELDNKWVTDFLLDTKGDLWLNVNNNTVARINPINNSYNIYHVNSGNRLDFFSSQGFYNLGESNIYLGGKNGILYFSPFGLKINEFSPEPVITEIKIDNESLLPGKEVNGEIPLSKDINETKSLSLTYKNRNFSLQFSAPSYANERLNKFEYMLDGFDDEWISTSSSSRTVQYTNLFPGDYNFKIRSSNSDGHWSETVSYKIKIERPIWFSYPALLFYVLLFGTIFYFMRQEFKNRMRLKQDLINEKLNRERDEKLNNEKLRFFTNISHELRTPLTLIMGPVKQLLEQGNHSSYAKSRVDLIDKNSNRLLRLVNQILDFRRAETGELELKVTKTDIIPYTEEIFNSFLELSQSKNINFNLNVEDGIEESWIDMDKYTKVLYNLLSNAMKFTNNYGNVDLFLGITEGEQRILQIEVSDDGIGIPLESQEKIFSRFYQAKNSVDSTTGTGIGLSLVKALVELHKGKISVESTPNIGSIFTIELPVSRKAYSETEIAKLAPPEEVKEKGTPILPDNFESKEVLSINETNSNTDIKHNVLIIDDNSELRNYVAEYLSSFYKVYQAENGKEGLEVCRKVKPVLCVVDVMMPIMDGFEFVEELKNDENISHTAVVLLTALAENENRIIRVQNRSGWLFGEAI